MHSALEQFFRCSLAPHRGQLKVCRRFATLLERKLQALFDKAAQGRALLFGRLACSRKKLVRNVDGGFHMGTHIILNCLE